MIRDLDNTLSALLTNAAVPGSELAGAQVNFDLPDATWRGKVAALTVNCYLYDVRENRDLRTNDMLLERSVDGTRAVRRRPPVRIDCAYCITAWSPAANESVLDEHRLLSQVLLVLLQNPTIPTSALQGMLVGQIPPYPTVIAIPDDAKNPDFWRALDQELKPSLNYVVTLAMRVDSAVADAAKTPVVTAIHVAAANLDELP